MSFYRFTHGISKEKQRLLLRIGVCLKPFDANGVFAPSVPRGGDTLRRLAVRGAGMTVFSGGLGLAIQVVATVVLARLLTPRDFGLVAMVTTFSLLLSNCGINGITEALVQREQIDHTLTSNLFWINLGGGSLLTGGFAAAGSILAKFYGEALVAPIAAGVSISIVLTSTSVIHLALLKRAMLFSAVAKNDIIARAASVIVSIAFGWAGWGYWALVLGVCALPLSTAIGAWILCRWAPGRPRHAPGTGAMLKFAMYTYGRFSVNYFARNTDNLLVGWRFGAPALGFYKKAYDLFSLSATQLVASTSVVAVSALSRVRGDSVRYRRYLLGAMAVMAFLGMGIAGDLTLIGKDLIRVLLGPGWESAGQIFTFFAPGIGIMILYGTHGWIHLSIGRADRWFRWGIVEWTVTILLFIAALHWGPQGIAVAWCVSFWTLIIPAMWYAGRPIGLGVGPIFAVVWRYIVASLLAGVASILILFRLVTLRGTAGASGAMLRVVFVSLLFVGLYLIAIVSLYRGFGPLQRLVGLLREMTAVAHVSRPSTATRAESRGWKILILPLMCFALTLYSHAQTWAPIPGSNRAIDWSNVGVGAIPARMSRCASLTPSATLAEINSALASCPGGETVYLAAGTYFITGTVSIPSNVTLRGAGAGLTVLNATGKGGGTVISLGSGSVSFKPVTITNGATAGSKSIEVGNASGIRVGMYLAISEINNLSYVSTAGSGGNCNWCDGDWTKSGSFARGQIVAVTGISGRMIAVSPGLYSAYTNTQIAVPFSMSESYAGVEDLQVYANNTGYAANFAMSECAYCWIKGVESNYADGDHVEVYWGFHDEIRDSYFSNAFLHRPGTHDSDIQIAFKTSASLVENNIIERTHASVMLEWGAAGNVVSYNYTMGEFDSEAINLDIGGIDFHGAHPQSNLLEGNVVTEISEDSVWGTSSQTTAFRNWVVGTNRICSPMSGRGTVNCSGTNGHYGFQAARAIELSYLGTSNNFVGNVVGSVQMQSLKGYNGPLAQRGSIEYPSPRSYDAVAYAWSFGYGGTGDDGTGTGCGGGIPPCHLSGTSSTDFFHGNYNNIEGSIAWASGVTRQLPASLYLSRKPAWWGSMPFPATGPDVTGGTGPGGHSYGNPAQACYLHVMGGSDGGAGGPLLFNPGRCYGKDVSAAGVSPGNRTDAVVVAPGFVDRHVSSGETQ
jgi:PST family polysaccharide transporter